MAQRRIIFTIEADLKNVFMVGLAVNRICAHLAFSELDAHQLETCVVEALNNVIKHAYRFDESRMVTVVVTAAAEFVQFDVCDDGHSMGTLTKRTLDFDPKDISSLPESGMGLYIIQQIMDSVEYRTIEGNNILSMTRRYTTFP